MANEALRGCPTCGTPVSDVDMGLRDYRWVSEAMPGRLAPMDVDFILERRSNLLAMEFKPEGMALPLGQRLTLKALRRLGIDVWVAWEGDKMVEVGQMDRFGNVGFVERMNRNKLRNQVTAWLKEADRG